MKNYVFLLLFCGLCILPTPAIAFILPYGPGYGGVNDANTIQLWQMEQNPAPVLNDIPTGLPMNGLLNGAALVPPLHLELIQMQLSIVLAIALLWIQQTLEEITVHSCCKQQHYPQPIPMTQQ